MTQADNNDENLQMNAWPFMKGSLLSELACIYEAKTQKSERENRRPSFEGGQLYLLRLREQPAQFVGLVMRQYFSKRIGRHEVVVREFKARDNSLKKDIKKLHTLKRRWRFGKSTYLTNQQTLALERLFLVWHQKACFVLVPFYNPLHPLTAVHVLPNHKCFNLAFLSFLLLACMYDDITPASSMQGVYRPASVPMEMSRRTGGRQQIVNGRTRRSS